MDSVPGSVNDLLYDLMKTASPPHFTCLVCLALLICKIFSFGTESYYD